MSCIIYLLLSIFWDFQGGKPTEVQITPYLYGRMKNLPPYVGLYGPAPAVLYHDDVGGCLFRLAGNSVCY